MRWEPLLDGELAEAAAGAVREVAAAIAAAPDRAAPVDRTVFWAYACGAIDDAFASAAYDASLEELVAQLEAGVASPALHGGLAGIGWTLAHVMDDGAGEVLAVVDEALLDALAPEPWAGPHDLAQGLVGIGVYFLERIGQGGAGEDLSGASLARTGLARVVQQLAACAERTGAGDGVTWHTRRELLPAFLHAEWPEGYYDCGVAHGVAGAIAMLARAAELPDPPPEARALRDRAVRWLAAQRAAPDPTGDCGRFPSRIRPGAAPDRARAAWCYGEPGAAAALWRAAPELARETALDAARRPVESSGVRDAGLCHGAAGLGHLFHRLHRASGEAALADAARAWFVRTLAMRRPAGDPAGFGGFSAWHASGPGEAPSDRPVASLVEGSLGIALALLAAITFDVEPSWDRLLLCDVPPRST